jgi:hypothetical protein
MMQPDADQFQKAKPKHWNDRMNNAVVKQFKVPEGAAVRMEVWLVKRKRDTNIRQGKEVQSSSQHRRVEY